MFSPLDYLFTEPCRICDTLICKRVSHAQTVCNACWLPLAGQPAQIDSCAIPGSGAPIAVAHAVSYEDTIKRLLYKLKYDNDRLIAADLALLLATAYDSITALVPATSQLVPIPLSRWRHLKRGYNQSELLSKHLSKIVQLQQNRSILRRVKHTRAQHNLSKPERSQNIQNAFACKLNFNANKTPDSFILIDDIHTSGATLAEAARTLYAAGAGYVCALTVARAPLHIQPP